MIRFRNVKEASITQQRKPSKVQHVKKVEHEMTSTMQADEASVNKNGRFTGKHLQSCSQTPPAVFAAIAGFAVEGEWPEIGIREDKRPSRIVGLLHERSNAEPNRPGLRCAHERPPWARAEFGPRKRENLSCDLN